MQDLGLVRYDAMVHAIAECHRVDELKDLSDKARALEMYAKQAQNTLAEREACNVRLRAERRCGELLRELERNPHRLAGRDANGAAQVSRAVTPEKSPYAQALEEANLSRQRANRMEALANVPAHDFEAALTSPVEKATVTGILDRARTAPPPPQIDKTALWFWGRLRDFESDGLFAANLDDLLATMPDTMRADVLRLVPVMRNLFSRLEEESHEFA